MEMPRGSWCMSLEHGIRDRLRALRIEMVFKAAGLDESHRNRVQIKT